MILKLGTRRSSVQCTLYTDTLLVGENYETFGGQKCGAKG